MITILRIIISISIILLFGCTRLPPYKQLELSSPRVTRIGIPIVEHSRDLSQASWWKKMHDPVLDQLMKEALANNNQIHTARANILQAQAKLQEARFAWLPTLSGSGNGFIGGGWDSSVTPLGPLAKSTALSKLPSIHFKGYYSGFVPSYTLNIMQIINNNKFAKASFEMQRAIYQSTRISIISQISGAYFMLLGQKEQFTIQSQLIRDLKTIRDLESVRYKNGASDLTTITHLDEQISTNQANLLSIENSISQIENSIQVLLNHNPAPLVTHATINTLSIHGLTPSNIPSAVLKNRPDIMIAEDSLKMSGATVGIAYSNFFPTISLTGLLGGASLELSHLLHLSTGLWIARAAASVPLLDGGAYERIKAAQAGYCASYYSYVQTLKSAFADVDNSLTNQQKMKGIYSNTLRALKATEKVYTLALSKYKAGAKDYREVANALLAVDNAKFELNMAKMQLLDSIVEVYQALAMA